MYIFWSPTLGGGAKEGRVEGGLEALGNCKRVKLEMVVLLLLFHGL